MKNFATRIKTLNRLKYELNVAESRAKHMAKILAGDWTGVLVEDWSRAVRAHEYLKQIKNKIAKLE